MHVGRLEHKIQLITTLQGHEAIAAVYCFAQYSPYNLPLSVLAASKGFYIYILFVITAADVVPTSTMES